MYKERFADAVIKERLHAAGAILIEGPKACGKTEMASQIAKSIIHMDSDPNIKTRMEVDPFLILGGENPRLIDEWQLFPEIWNYVRREVDNRKQMGQFILTGSSTPEDDYRRHSGVGRFSIIQLSTMSLYEKDWSSGEVSLLDTVSGQPPTSSDVPFSLGDYAEMMTLGGWPGLINKSATQGRRFAIDYVNLVSDVDISRVSDKKRDPVKIKKLIQSLARNVSTEVSIAALSKDTNGSDGMLDANTISDYLTALDRLMVSDNLPAWNVHIRSSDKLRKSPKRHFVDPSICIGALELSIDKILSDLSYFGLLFESLVIRDLKIYADAIGGKVYHYRDSRDLEVDAIVEFADGSWSAFEIKLGMGSADDAAKSLLTLSNKIDKSKASEPSSLNVITANGFAHRRKDGINVIPIGTLTK